MKITSIRLDYRTPEQRARIAESSRPDTSPRYMAPGVYTETIADHPGRIDTKINAFHARMAKTYSGYTVLNTSVATLPGSVVFYLTYQIGPAYALIRNQAQAQPVGYQAYPSYPGYGYYGYCGYYGY